MFRHDDLLGSLRFLTNGSEAVTGNLLSDAFGETVSASGSLPSPFGFIGEEGCQTDTDIGLVLMGHRYYDTRIGRFISQDPAGSGDNWYAYADNDPMDEVDPSGLTPTVNIEGWSPAGSPGYSGVAAGAQGFDDYQYDTQKWVITHSWVQDIKLGQDDLFHWVDRPGSDTWTLAADTSLDGTAADARLTKELAAADDGTAGTIKSNNPFKGIEDAVQKAKKWLGDLGKHVENKDGDHVFMNKAGTKKLRFDINNPSPHENPHAHLEELINGKWRGVGQIYPRDVPPR